MERESIQNKTGFPPTNPKTKPNQTNLRPNPNRTPNQTEPIPSTNKTRQAQNKTRNPTTRQRGEEEKEMEEVEMEVEEVLEVYGGIMLVVCFPYSHGRPSQGRLPSM